MSVERGCRGRLAERAAAALATRSRAARGARASRGLAAIVALALGCARSEPARSGAAPAPDAERVASGLDTRFRPVEAAGQGIEIDLPDADGWRRDARERRSFVAVHPATGSRLMVRAWSAGAVVRPDGCERELRQLVPDLPRLAPAERVEERALRVAGDHAAQLVAGVVPSPEAPGALAGHALLFGSAGRRCLALIYSTAARGGAAPRVIGERLGSMIRVSFERARRLGVEERVQVQRP